MPGTPDLSSIPRDQLEVRYGPYVSLLADPSDELRLESLVKGNRLEGWAYRFTVVIPLLSDVGEEVFSLRYDLPYLTSLLNHRFGGSTSPSHSVGPPLVGNWDGALGLCQDQNTNLMIYSRRVPAAEDFFRKLKEVLKVVGVQEEILIEKADVTLVG